MATTMEEPWLDKNRMELWLNSPVKEINSEDSAMKGENYLSTLKKLEVKTECGEVYPLIVKCRMEVGVAADTFRKTSIFRKEQEMYRNILQKMSQLLRDAFPDSFSRFSAKSYYTCKSFLVLEDLKAQGFKMEDRKVGLELDQCLLVMRNLARFHASSVILYQQDPDIFEKFNVSFFTEEAIQESMQRVWRGMTRSLANELDTWEEEWHKYAEKLRRLEDDIMNRVKEVARDEDSRFSVLIHGDLWTNNLMFKNKTDELRFVDFQLAHFTSPAIDLHYFITSSTNLETRRKHRGRLLEEYHNTLCETLIALGYKEKLMTLDELYLEMDRKSMYGVFTLLGPFAVMQLESDCGFSFDEALATGWNPGSAMYGEIYKEVVKIMLPLFDSKDGEIKSAVPPWMDLKTLELWLQTPVIDCMKKEAGGKGDNYLSDLHRVVVKTKDGDLSLIVKCRIEEGTAAEVLKESTIFRKEQEMYSNTLPRMDQLLRNALPGYVEPLGPKCYYTCKSFLVMEDLSALGYTMMDRQLGLDLNQCLVVMRAVARFHATSILLHEQNPDSMREYPENFYSEPATKHGTRAWFRDTRVPPMSITAMNESETSVEAIIDPTDKCKILQLSGGGHRHGVDIQRAMLEAMIEELKSWPAAQWAPYIEKLQHFLPDFHERVIKSTRKTDTDFNVLTHGDVWINNILYRDDVMRLIDFQFVQYTSFGVELHMFLTTSPKVDVRINHMDTLIQEYHTTLCSTMTALGCKRKLPALQELREEFHRKAMFGVFGLVCAAPLITASPTSGFDLSDAMKGKTPGTAMYTEFFREGMKWALPFLDNMGAFNV